MTPKKAKIARNLNYRMINKKAIPKLFSKCWKTPQDERGKNKQ